MKKGDSIFIIVVILLVLSLSACQSDESEKGQNQAEAKKKENQTEESPEERAKRIESGILLYGEGQKSGEYGITLNTAYSEMNAFRDSQTAKPYVVQAVVRVRNVTEDKTLNAGTIGFELRNEKTGVSYEGELLPNMNTSNLELEPEENAYLQVTFEVVSIEDDFMFYAHLWNEPDFEKTRWKIENLETFE
ncbi:hypothetical protein [Sediminibacillus sp. JSM 1682029]|uniref:hypothetical protein n=1 Tax=Sediminibacillus sp. JSM 1682029 TaxID=3229857 RepID=UPI00352604C9